MSISGATPTPRMFTAVGLPTALCVIVTALSIVPVAVGLNTTVNVELYPGAIGDAGEDISV